MEDNTNQGNQKSSTSLMLVGGIIVSVVVLGGAVFFLNSNKSTAPSRSEAVSPEAGISESMLAEGTEPGAMDSDMVESGDVLTINMEAGSFYYKPDEIRVKKGQKVKIVMNSVDMMHDFNIDELGVKIPVTQSGNTATVEFTADTVGEFEYYCSVSNHRLQGQVGTLIVE